MTAERPVDAETTWLPVRRVNLSENVADQLISRILQGQLAWGDKLPPERDLAALLGVGRPTIREAIRTLSVIGLVETRPGEGTFIVDRHAEFVAKAFSWTLLLDARTAKELIDVRTAVEAQQARLAARLSTDEDAARLNAIVAEMNEGMSRADFFQVDLEFHLAIGKIASNIALERLLVSSRSLLRQWTELAAKISEGLIPTAMEQHREIAAAIVAHDEDAADATMRKHTETVGQTIAEAAALDLKPEVKDSAQQHRFDAWPW